MEGDAVLIAAQSGRALAAAARRAGLRPYVLDLFGDEDTRALAAGYRPLPGRFGSGLLGGAALLDGLEALAAEAGPGCLGVVLGSGFEGVPALIARVAGRHRLLGASPEAVARLKDPFAFAALCGRLGIPHPAVRRAAVPDPAGWLVKAVGGCGGGHIRAAVTGAAPPGHYLQARVPGQAYALNILADGHETEGLALTRQWSAPSRLRPFRFAGAVMGGRDEPSPVPPGVLVEVTEAAARLVAQTGLRGLASLDLLVEGEDWWLTEVNPRPGATLDVLDRRACPLLRAHIEACLGGRSALGPAPEDAAGTEICYAARTLDPVPPIEWPDHAHDRPRAGTRVGRDAPLCTVAARGPDAATVRHTLRERREAVRQRLDEKEYNHECGNDPTEPQRAHGAAGRSTGR